MANLFAYLTRLTYTLFVLTWLSLINKNVPEPYLVRCAEMVLLENTDENDQDEFFHVQQAQLYLQGRFDAWHPKITTPAGLYVPHLENLLQRSRSAILLESRVVSLCTLLASRCLILS